VSRRGAGQVERVAPGRGALGSGGHRSPRSSQRVLGSVLRQWLGPVVSHCSLEAAYAERPALDDIHPDQDTARPTHCGSAAHPASSTCAP